MTDRSTLNSTIEVLEQHFDLSAEGYLCQRRDLWQVLVAVCARQSTIESTCNDLHGPDSNTIRGYLNQQLRPEKIPRLQRECNEALDSQLPFWLWEHPQQIACDLHEEPYYGEYDVEDPDNWVRGDEARDGTSHFYCCATAYIIHRGVRMTLEIEFVNPNEALVCVLEHLLSRVKELGITYKSLFLDRGFCSIPIMASLLAQGLPVLMATPVKGKKGGTRALCQGRGSYFTQHTFRSPIHGPLTVPVAVVRTFARRHHGPLKAQWLVYVVLNMPALPIRAVRKTYRLRFGIESSYRMMEKNRPRTTSHNPALRFLFMSLALILLNIWIALQWAYLRIRGRGPRRVANQFFRQDRMQRFLSGQSRPFISSSLWSTRQMSNPLSQTCDLPRLLNADESLVSGSFLNWFSDKLYV